MRIVLTVFAPLLVATGIRLALLLLGLVCAGLCELIRTIAPSIDHIADFESCFYAIGGFDTFDFNASWFYWVLVIIGSFIAEYLIWQEAEEEERRRKEEERRKEEAIQREPIYNKLDISITATTIRTDISLGIACTTDVIIDWGDDTETEILRTNQIQKVEKKYNSNGSHIIIVKGEVTELYVDTSDLTTLDVSKCTALTSLDCGYNQLTTLNVTKNTALTKLSCWGNQLTSLDISKNTALTYLSCWDNQLTSLDVSKNTALTELQCTDNQLTSLDISKNTELTSMNCDGNPFTAEEMNKIYEALPTVEYGQLFCDKLGAPSIAEQKGWEVTLY